MSSDDFLSVQHIIYFFAHSLEIYFKDSRSLLLVFPNKADREHILNKLQLLQFKSSSDVGNSPAMLRSPLLSFVSAKVNQAFQGKDEISTAQRRWQAREISTVGLIPILPECFSIEAVSFSSHI